jgi:hypothetical protein
MIPNHTAHLSHVDELEYILACVANADCCAIVGLSNMGKSTLLRSVGPFALQHLGQVQANQHALIYIDLNLMVDMTEQALYELILRSVRARLEVLDEALPILERVQEAYQRIVDSSNPFLIPLGFNEGIIALCEGLNQRVALLLDEFDEPFTQIDARVFLNLRALKDRYDQQLCYVVATGKRLEKMREGSEIGEFCELFAHQTLWLRPLSREDAQHAARAFLAQEGAEPAPGDLDFVWRQAGGHPGLIEAVCHVLAEVGGGGTDHSIVRDNLDSDPAVRGECVKLWAALDPEQQETLTAFVGGEGQERDRIVPLLRNGILRQERDRTAVFGSLFGGFVRRQWLIKNPYPPGVRLEVDSGDVWVDGQRTPALTDLEYRLLLLLYGRIGKICDKYQIVEAVWGQDYIDQVDDARIEKLVSRLRKKIEPDASEPHYVQTVRGRGYRLVEA